MSKEIKVIKQTVSVLNKQDLFILYEKLCKEAEIDEYHYTNFIKLLEFSKLESKNAVLLIKSISKYIIPIISDGKNFSHDPAGESWIGRSNMAAPYTQVEHDMLHHAYHAIGTPIESALDDERKEPKDTYAISPVVAHRGYEK